jgi:hypothetical protein
MSARCRRRNRRAFSSPSDAPASRIHSTSNGSWIDGPCVRLIDRILARGAIHEEPSLEFVKIAVRAAVLYGARLPLLRRETGWGHGRETCDGG